MGGRESMVRLLKPTEPLAFTRSTLPPIIRPSVVFGAPNPAPAKAHVPNVNAPKADAPKPVPAKADAPKADAPKLAGPAYPSFFVRFGDAYTAELTHFLKFARGEAPNLCTAQDALEALRIAEAAGRSWRERRTVKLSEIE